MYKVITILLLTCCSFTLMALQGKANNEILQESEKSIYQASLNCQNKLITGAFQKCSLSVFMENQPVKNTQIFMSGGMPGHHHGLPTSPKVNWSEEDRTYLIKGLKFSMRGKWILNFKINATEVTDKDIISMEVTVN